MIDLMLPFGQFAPRFLVRETPQWSCLRITRREVACIGRVALVPVHFLLVAVQQLVGYRDISHLRRRAHHRVHQTVGRIGANVLQLYIEI